MRAFAQLVLLDTMHRVKQDCMMSGRTQLGSMQPTVATRSMQSKVFAT